VRLRGDQPRVQQHVLLGGIDAELRHEVAHIGRGLVRVQLFQRQLRGLHALQGLSDNGLRVVKANVVHDGRHVCQCRRLRQLLLRRRGAQRRRRRRRGRQRAVGGGRGCQEAHKRCLCRLVARLASVEVASAAREEEGAGGEGRRTPVAHIAFATCAKRHHLVAAWAWCCRRLAAPRSRFYPRSGQLPALLLELRQGLLCAGSDGLEQVVAGRPPRPCAQVLLRARQDTPQVLGSLLAQDLRLGDARGAPNIGHQGVLLAQLGQSLLSASNNALQKLLSIGAQGLRLPQARRFLCFLGHRGRGRGHKCGPLHCGELRLS